MEHDDYVSEGYATTDEDDWISKWELQSMLGIPNPLNNWGFVRKRPKKKQFTVEKAEELYQKAQQAKVGETIECPTCMCKFTKKTYQQKFHKLRCKDKFWNSVDETRRERAKRFKN